MMLAFFLLNVLLVVYIYFGYPSIVFLLSRIYKRKHDKFIHKADISVIIAAYNEEQHIRQTVINKLEQVYSGGKVEVIVVSDDSTDATNAILEDINNENFRYFVQTPRQGKTSAVNMAINHASGDLVVFSDANSLYREDAIEKLASNFANPEVGYVTGKMIYSNADGSVIGDGCTQYMRYENFIRACESSIGSVVGVDGGIDAIRKDIYEQLNPDQLPDFVQPLCVIEKGYRVVYEPEAILKEESLTDQSSEYKMRTRVSLRALWALYDMRSLLNPLKYPMFSWQLISHKVLRYLAWIPLVAIFFINFLLLGSGFLFVLIFLGQLAFYLLSFLGWKSSDNSHQSSITSLPYYFVLINVAAAHAFIRFIKKEKTVIWNPRTG